MAEVWDEAKVQQYIDDGIEESLNLDYKAAGALGKSDGKKKEITKDVSAMANSDGGIIIYGISENGHLPGALDPIHRQDFSKEWLDNVVSSIRPNIEGLAIHPVSISSADNGVVYVVEIPQSYTAHQAQDKRYYKRVGFKSRPMEDYEIRDVMNRLKHPFIEMSFRIVRKMRPASADQDGLHYVPEQCILETSILNKGAIYANFVSVFLWAPTDFMCEWSGTSEPVNPIDLDLAKVHRFICENVEEHANGFKRYLPLLPGLNLTQQKFNVALNYNDLNWYSATLKWQAHADNAPLRYGEVAIADIGHVDIVE